ncbi:SIMPL domain-containing protein [Congregibacter brevis]|uniref:SIMPL domain-containing protein n=1 Tax=Congregibacter brevis TaxID=3081201 RepID=A0ABZ0IC93_9GAMM|nr:SIMPL domain-containing protein [Congregibacter sp. IMCC45268]
MNNSITAIVIALGLIVGGAFIGNGLEHFRMADRSIVIKGLAEQSVDSDYVTWPLTVRRAADSFQSVQESLAADRDKLVEFLHGLGFTRSEMEIRPLVVNDAYSREYASSNSPTRYSGSALVIVKSERVDAVASAALATDPLIAAGVQLDLGAGPQYTLRAFNDAKGPLLKAATENARAQATKFAAESGASLGGLKSANQGIIQITGTGGNRYDSASSREKRLRVVSTFVYYLE